MGRKTREEKKQQRMALIVENGTDGREGWGRLRAGRASEERCIPTLPLSNAPETLEAHATESQAL